MIVSGYQKQNLRFSSYRSVLVHSFANKLMLSLLGIIQKKKNFKQVGYLLKILRSDHSTESSFAPRPFDNLCFPAVNEIWQKREFIRRPS